ncbi:MAG: serine/threonine-protein kinase HipA [Gammaproteobacteria bacterium]|jgi:serine/threonine-protein kinase HipA
MSLNGKRDRFDVEDFKACAKNISMKRGRAEEILKEVQDAVLKWKSIAKETGVADDVAKRISKAQRIDILR